MHEVQIVEREDLPPDELDALLRWLEVAFGDGPWRKDHWTDVGPGPHAILRDDDGTLLAHACVDRITVLVGDRALQAGYLEDVATRADVRGRGFGTAVVAAAQREIERRAEIGFLATGEFGFYERLGWRRWVGPTSVSEADGTVTPTPDEDGYIMWLPSSRTPAWVVEDLPVRRPRRDPEEAW